MCRKCGPILARLDAVEVFHVADEDDPLKECVVDLPVHEAALGDQTQDSQVVGDVPHERISICIFQALWRGTYPAGAKLSTASTTSVESSSDNPKPHYFPSSS